MIMLASLLVWTDLQVPALFERPSIFWEDVNADGVMDIWIRSEDGLVWYWPGGSRETDLHFLGGNAAFLDARPVLMDEQVVLVACASGMILQYRDDTWAVVQDLSHQVSVQRTGFSYQSPRLLFPASPGYLAVSVGCEPEILEVKPAIKRKDRSIQISYPVPLPEQLLNDATYMAPVLDADRGKLLIQVLDRSGKLYLSETLFPFGFALNGYTYGDINGDGWLDLAVLCAPDKDMSIFEELTLMVVMGSDRHLFDNHVLLSLRTEQNLWQKGPMVIERGAVITHYYKGLMSAKFRRDVYFWDEAGFLNPEPKSMRWKLDDANRGWIAVDLDFNGDQRPDLLLLEQGTLRIHYQTGSDMVSAFAETPQTLSYSRSGGYHDEIELAFSGDATLNVSVDIGKRNRLRGRSGVVLVADHGSGQFWRVRDEGESLTLSPIELR